MLYAFEGVLQNRHWLDIANNQKVALMMALEEHEEVEKRLYSNKPDTHK
ncbi:hypothetical protein HG263_03275 [Pseudoalteromonas sp. JBTF-M23]|uniref:Uncharacterized protein n=1 Tax=Pseudoalteromonas caenipelagi TaxID=2726988 RepID=A0A849VAB4_9GAMM|nr:hypothetical protein [Pseudoalteromonas caenipelagi]NOU49563.1 hypothetical protein [Pseudoalteromonas caenipelagi]